MNTPFFNSSDRVALLEERANAWRGTPWRQNSMAIGVGVSCHNLPRALYAESLFWNCPEIPSSPAEATALNMMEKFLDEQPEMERVDLSARDWILDLRPGDLLGLFIPINNIGGRIRGRVVNHLGVILPKLRFIHTLLKRNTMIDQANTPPWSQIIVAAWRPIIIGSLSA